METASSSHCDQGRGRIAPLFTAIESPCLDFTHFVSLPLAIHRELIDKLVSFQSSILGGYKVPYEERQAIEKKNKEFGIDKSIFVNPRTFHLTVLMLKLGNQDGVAQATQVLQSTSLKVMKALKNRPIFIKLKGLDLMRGSINEARVVYAPVEEIVGEGRLLQACKVIIDAYMKAGLVHEKDAKQAGTLKLHATIMNAKFRKSMEGEQERNSFDARSIFKQHGSREWGEYIIHGAHLSQRFASDKNGYYHCCASIPFPENRRGQQIQGVGQTSQKGNIDDFGDLGQGRGRSHAVNINNFQALGQSSGWSTGNGINQFKEQGQGRGRGRGRGRTVNINDFQRSGRGGGRCRGRMGSNMDFQGRGRG